MENKSQSQEQYSLNSIGTIDADNLGSLKQSFEFRVQNTISPPHIELAVRLTLSEMMLDKIITEYN